MEELEVGFAENDAEKSLVYFGGRSQQMLHHTDFSSTPLDHVDVRVNDPCGRARVRHWSKWWKIDDDIVVILPQAGDQFVVVADRDKARGISEYREQKAREAALAKSSRVSLEGLAEQIKTAGTKELNIILKGDVGGSVEVLSDLLAKLSNDKVRLKLLRSGVGAITETDVLLASASNAIIIGFNVRPERKAQELAEQEEVDIRLHSIIYELQDEIKRAMSGLLEPTIKETYQGRAEVLETFRIPKVGTIAGCRVTDGVIKRDSEVRLLRDNVVVFKGKVGSLRRFKDDAKEVTNGMECGISIANYGDIKARDVIEAFATERIAAEVIA